MNRTYVASPPRKSKSPKPIIRSDAFRKKFQDGMPRINQKAIPFHNFYDIEITNFEIAQEHGLQFWGCVLPEKRKFHIRHARAHEKQESPTRGQTIFKNYMKRRPSLPLTSRSLSSHKQETTKNYETISDFRSDRVKQQPNIQKQENPYHSARETANRSPIGSFLVTQDEITTINKKSLYEMNPRELEISIEWKKRFLDIFEKKMKDTALFEYNFRPYRI